MRTLKRWSLRASFVLGLALSVASCGFLPISTMSATGTDVLERAPKPAPVDSAFDGCGEAGSQPDYVLNRRKNRVDEGQYIPVSWRMLAQLPWPRRVGYRFRNQWTPGETRDVARYEGVAVEVEGYIANFRMEPPEPPNCYSAAPRTRDYHLWLSEGANGAKKQSIVIEVTPRVRVSHPEWNEERLAALANTQVRVRVRGWLMFDQMHPESIGGTRITLWEVHPIMHVDWRSSKGKWVSLDSLSPAADSAADESRALR